MAEQPGAGALRPFRPGLLKIHEYPGKHAESPPDSGPVAPVDRVVVLLDIGTPLSTFRRAVAPITDDILGVESISDGSVKSLSHFLWR